jgi:hypothetical protein
LTEGAKRLSALLTRDVLEAFAWGHSFERGQGYAEAGLVRNLRATETGIMAKVTGTHIRTGLDEEPPAPSGKHTIWRLPPADGTVLVEIFLYEEDVATAWREAQSRGCASRLWLELAGRREKTHPADAIAIYRKHVDDLLRQTGNPVYEQAVNYLDKIRNLHQGADGKAAFQAYLQDLRNTQKRKRNLMKMLDGKGW